MPTYLENSKSSARLWPRRSSCDRGFQSQRQQSGGEPMKPSEVKQLKLGTPVWVWIVRFGRGRWWFGTVEGIETIMGLPHIKVRFESFSPTRHRSDPPVTVGFVTARMRRLERRDVSV